MLNLICFLKKYPPPPPKKKVIGVCCTWMREDDVILKLEMLCFWDNICPVSNIFYSNIQNRSHGNLCRNANETRDLLNFLILWYKLYMMILKLHRRCDRKFEQDLGGPELSVCLTWWNYDGIGQYIAVITVNP